MGLYEARPPLDKHRRCFVYISMPQHLLGSISVSVCVPPSVCLSAWNLREAASIGVWNLREIYIVLDDTLRVVDELLCLLRSHPSSRPSSLLHSHLNQFNQCPHLHACFPTLIAEIAIRFIHPTRSPNLSSMHLPMCPSVCAHI